MITTAMLRAVAPTTPAAELAPIAAPMSAACQRFGIDTPKRIAAFLSQCSHESQGFTKRTESLYYRAERLTEVWRKRFPTLEAARPYARNPERLANHVYASRMGNGDEASGDGWRFRGRGYKQLTGRENYARFAKAMAMTLDAAVAYAETIEGACMSAAWFWATNSLNAYADVGDVRSLTFRINGGFNGLRERQALYAAACKACGVAA